MRFNDIHIIESLTGGFAGRTGACLHELIEPIVLASNRPVEVHYHRVETAVQLLERFDVIRIAALERGRFPILHLEAHGNEEHAADAEAGGLFLADGDFLTWKQLQPHLTAINQATHLNLVVLVAACNGLDLLHAVRPTNRAPVRLVIGPHRRLSDGEIETATRAFYTMMLATFDGVRAFDAINDAIEPPSATRRDLFYGMSAERMFWFVMRRYFEEDCTDARIDTRIDEHIAARVREDPDPSPDNSRRGRFR